MGYVTTQYDTDVRRHQGPGFETREGIIIIIITGKALPVTGRGGP
jgi:hypothetical protein